METADVFIRVRIGNIPQIAQWIYLANPPTICFFTSGTVQYLKYIPFFMNIKKSIFMRRQATMLHDAVG